MSGLHDAFQKLVERCSLPLTAAGVVSTVITEHAVFRWDDGLVLTELLDGATEEQVAAETGAVYRVALGVIVLLLAGMGTIS